MQGTLVHSDCSSIAAGLIHLSVAIFPSNPLDYHSMRNTKNALYHGLYVPIVTAYLHVSKEGLCCFYSATFQGFILRPWHKGTISKFKYIPELLRVY